MTKPFNIHDWQAKQRLNLLNEHDAFGNAGTDKRTGQVTGNILELIRSTGIDPMDVMEEIAQEFNINFDFNGGAPGMTKYGDKMPGPGRGLEEKKGVKHYTKDGKEWTGPTHKMPNGPLMTQNPHSKDSVELFHKEDLDEMNTTGGGASFNAGSGEGYMTPNAFKKKKKK